MASSSLRQVVLLRKDLLHSSPSWTLGAVTAQAVHAAVDCLAQYESDDQVKEYLKHRSSMTTIILSLKDHQDLLHCHETLTKLCVDHVVWHEMPDNIPTSIALKPYTKQAPHQSYLKQFALFI